MPGWTLPRPTPPRLHQAPPHPGAPRHLPHVQHLEMMFPSGVPPLSPRAASARLLALDAAAPAARCCVSCCLHATNTGNCSCRPWGHLPPGATVLPPSSCCPQHRLLPLATADFATRNTVNCSPAHELPATGRSGLKAHTTTLAASATAPAQRLLPLGATMPRNSCRRQPPRIHPAPVAPRSDAAGGILPDHVRAGHGRFQRVLPPDRNGSCHLAAPAARRTQCSVSCHPSLFSRLALSPTVATASATLGDTCRPSLLPPTAAASAAPVQRLLPPSVAALANSSVSCLTTQRPAPVSRILAP